MALFLVWAEVDLHAISRNIKALKQIISRHSNLMAVVKANAYGHGVCEVALRAVQSGADSVAVARVNEAVQLRKAGISAPILILGYTSPHSAGQLIDFDLTQTVFSYPCAKAFSEYAFKNDKKIKVHLKVDTGMGRLGILPGALHNTCGKNGIELSAIEEVEAISRLKGIDLEGIFTHFASADSSDKTYADRQFALFSDFLKHLEQVGIDIPIKHSANSAAIIDMPETHMDMVRAGISIYGLYPSGEVDKNRIRLEPAMTFKTRIIQLKKVPAGFKVSYGSTYETDKPTIIATVPVGYADGYNRLLSSRGYMLVKGVRVPVVGRVCMDLTLLDVGHVPEVAVEDEVVIFGKQGNAEITVDEIAAQLNTINYEIVSMIMDRVPRVYLT